jgi:hypothetical protein
MDSRLDEEKNKSNNNAKEITLKSLIIVSIIGLVLASPIFIYSLFFNKTSPPEPENPPPDETNTCNGLASRRSELGISNWDEVNQRFWEQTDYPYGEALDSNHPNYDYYQEQW